MPARVSRLRPKLIRQVGETRLLNSIKPSKADGNGISAPRFSAQTSAIVPGNVPCGVSCHSSTQRCSSQAFIVAKSGKPGIPCKT